jgi:hypothetical protein
MGKLFVMPACPPVRWQSDRADASQTGFLLFLPAYGSKAGFLHPWQNVNAYLNLILMQPLNRCW